MPRTSSASRSDVRRRDRHKVYAVTDFHNEGRGDSSPQPAITKEGLKGKCSSRAAALARGKEECCGRVGVQVPDRNSSHEGPAASAVPAAAAAAAAVTANTGSVGPGAEPPVAIASHAFAYEEPHTEVLLSNSSKSSKTGQPEEHAGDGSSFPDDELVGTLPSEEDVGTGRSICRGRTTETSRRCHSGKKAIARSRPGSANTNNEEEAETLPDSFSLSDAYGLDGASTGRNHHDIDDECSDKLGQPAFFGSDIESASSGYRGDQGRGRPAGRYSRTRREDDVDHDASSSGNGSRQGKGGEGVYPSASDSDYLPSSSRERQVARGHTSPPPQFRFGRRPRQDSRPPLATKRNLRVVPVEAPGERRVRESEGTRQHRRGHSRNGAQYRTRPPRRHSRVAEDDHHRRCGRRGVSRPRSRNSRRLAQTEEKSISGEAKYTFEAEVARLRRENEALKQQQEWLIRSSDEGSEAEPWSIRQDPNNRHASRRSPLHSSRRREPTVRNARHRNRLSRKSDALKFQQRPRDRPRGGASSPADTGIPPARSSSGRTQDGSTPRAAPAPSWSDFVSRSKPSPQRPGAAAWGEESPECPAQDVDLGLPSILVEGGFLWKLPYHNAGTPKRRWFQIKPAEGLLTTASGRLVVRPTPAGGGGTAAWDGGGALSERGDDGGSGKDSATSMPMMRLRAAWPLAFIWVDPDKDLKRSPPREICIEEIVDLARGHKTPAFWQQAAHRGIHTLPDPKLCFSLIGHDRTLDLAAETLSEAKEWVLALARVTLMIKRGGILTAIGDPPESFSRSQLEPLTCSNAGEVRVMEAGENDTNTLCDEGVYPRRSVGAPAPRQKHPSQQNLSAHSQAGDIEKNSPLLGEGGVWSVDTIRAWRRRLFPAVTRGDVPAVLALLDQGCPVDLVQTGTGDTPMLLACRLGDFEMARECLRRGARNDPHPEFGQTALHAAVASGQEACARLLLETAAPSRSDAVISNHKDPNKETPLHVACRGGYSGIVDALLHHGADMRAVDKRGNTPLHGAAGGGHADALASLLDAGGDGILEERNMRGERALHAAAAAGHIACVELLLGIAAEPDVPNGDGQTPFAVASRGGHLAVTRLIRQYAPEAGTPSGGDAQFQALQLRRVNGGSTTADALPRPHASGSASSGPGTPDRRSRDLGHRCYAAAGRDQQQLEASAGGRESPSSGHHGQKVGADVAERGLLQGGGGQHQSGIFGHDGDSHILTVPRPAVCDEQVPRSSPVSSSAPVHGSLFDGLQVYVVGGRQPLGSQHAFGAAAAGRLSARSAHTTTNARTMVLDNHRLSMSSCQHQHQRQQWEQPQEQPQNCYPSSQHTSRVSAPTASLSSGDLAPNWRDHFLSAPSTVAPSPPMPLHSSAGKYDGGSTALLSAIGPTGTPPPTGGEGTSQVGVSGSARALARMMHFSGNRDHTIPSSGEGSDSPGRGSTKTSVTGSSFSSSTSSGGNVAVEIGGAAVGSGGGGGSVDGTPTEAIGSWMTSGDHDQDKLVWGSTASNPKLGQRGDQGDTEPTSQCSAVAGTKFSGGVDCPETSGWWISDSGEAEREGVAGEQTAAGGYSFVVQPSKEQGERPEKGVASVHLPGIWRVFESQGYPYYLHEASGHSQWEDPRENETVLAQKLLLTKAPTDVAMGVQDQVSYPCFEGTKGPRREKGVETATKEAVEAPLEMDEELPPPASPIKAAGLSVAVDAFRYVDTSTVTRSAAESADYVGEVESMPRKNTEQQRSNGEFFETALEENPVHVCPSVDSCGSTDSRDFGSIDEEAGLRIKNGENNKNESSCSGLYGNAAGITSHRSTDTPTSGGVGRSRGDREDPDKGAGGGLRPDVAIHDDASIPVDRTNLNVMNSTCGTKNGHDDERKGQEEETEEEWWQELDDGTTGDKNL